MQFLGKFGKIVCWRPLGSWRPLLGEILDPSLIESHSQTCHVIKDPETERQTDRQTKGWTDSYNFSLIDTSAFLPNNSKSCLMFITSYKIYRNVFRSTKNNLWWDMLHILCSFRRPTLQTIFSILLTKAYFCTSNCSKPWTIARFRDG